MTTQSEKRPIVQGPFPDLALHTIGWKAFQDLCAQICEEEFKTPVEIYREANCLTSAPMEQIYGIE